MTEQRPGANAFVLHEPASQLSDRDQREAEGRRETEEELVQNQVEEHIALRDYERRTRYSLPVKLDRIRLDKIVEEFRQSVLEARHGKEAEATQRERHKDRCETAIVHQALEQMGENRDKATELFRLLALFHPDTFDAEYGVNRATALHLAAERGQVIAAEALIELGADINALDHGENTPLHTACWRHHANFVSLLLDSGARTDLHNNCGWSVLYSAIRNGHTKIVELLLSRDNTALNSTSLELTYGWTALHAAIYFGHAEVVDILLSKGAQLGAVDIDRRTPLMVATRNKDVKMVTQLLDSPRAYEEDQLEIKDGNGDTPLMWAAMNSFSAGVICLIRAGADCNTRSRTLETPLIAASFSGNVKSVSAILKQAERVNIEINACNKEGQTALHSAILRDNTKMVELLLKATKLNVMLQDNAGRSAVHLASHRGNEAILQMLLGTRAGQDLDVLDKRGMTPIEDAIDAGNDYQSRLSDYVRVDDKLQSQRHSAVVRILLERGARLAHPLDSGKGLLRLAGYSHDPGLTESFVTKMDFAGRKDGNTEQDRSSFGALLAWAASDARTHHAAKLLIMESHKAKTEPKTPRSMDLSAIEWAVWMGLPKELWLLIVTSPRDAHTTSAIERAREWIHKGVEMQASSEVREELKDIISTPPDSLPTTQVWKDSRNLGLPTFEKRTLFGGEQEHGQGQRFGFLEHFKVAMMQFYRDSTQFASIRRDRAVRKVIYDKIEGQQTGPGGPRAIMEEARDDARRYWSQLTDVYHGPGKLEEPIYLKSEHEFTWVHLPFTNMLWMEDLLQRIMYDAIYTPHQFLQVKSFFRNSWDELPDKTSESRIMRPRFVMTNLMKAGDDGDNDTDRMKTKSERQKTDHNRRAEQEAEGHSTSERAANQHVREGGQGKDKKDTGRLIAATAIYMPYVTYATHFGVTKDAENYEEVNRNAKEHPRLPIQEYVDQEKVLRKHSEDRRACDDLLDCYSKHVIHGPSTLDEWYYHFSKNDTESQKERIDRNKTQVVTKHLLGGTEGLSSWPLVRVNQLWLWTLDKKWVITASPPCAIDGGKDLFLDGLLNHLGKQKNATGQPATTDDMTKLIVDYCVGSYEKLPSSQGQRLPKDLSIRQVFSNSINTIGTDETRLFKQFRTRPDSWRAHLKAQGGQDNREQESGQTSASGEILRTNVERAEDLSAKIKDVRDELNILKAVAQYQRDVQEGMYWGQGGSQIVESGNDIRRILGADLSAEHIVNDIKEMDIVAERIQSVVNTTLSLQQSEVASQQAQLSVKQGRTLMIFTVVTILFLPLSFLSSLFALDVDSFQKAPGWALVVIFSVSVAFFIPFTAAALPEMAARLWRPSQDRFRHFFSKFEFPRFWRSPPPPPSPRVSAQATYLSDLDRNVLQTETSAGRQGTDHENLEPPKERHRSRSMRGLFSGLSLRERRDVEQEPVAV